VFLSRKLAGIALISFVSKSLKEKGWNETDENEKQEHGHKDLQPGQSGVLVEEVVWNRADVVIVQMPKRKKVGMRWMTKKNKNPGTQRLTIRSIRCSCRGSRLEL